MGQFHLVGQRLLSNGTGGAPEGVIAATALKCLGGDFQAILVPQNETEYIRCIKMGIANPKTPLTLDDIVKTDNYFFVATGITDGMFLKDVQQNQEKSATLTHSLAIVSIEQYLSLFIIKAN
ncbi:fructose-bisphosphatase class II [Bacillus sp. MM2020_1]|nr:fructose-bisphosphatase class II [Bacillus sp. MM2020_1]